MDLLAQLLVNAVVNGSEYALLGLGFGLIFATTRIMHFGYGPIFTLSAFVAWYCAAVLHLPPVIAGGAGIAGGAVAGMAAFAFVYRPFERSGMSTHSIFIVSLGLAIILQALISIVFGTGVHVVSDFETQVFLVGPLFFTDIMLIRVGGLIAVVLVLLLFLRRTRFGAAILAMSDNLNMAQIVGIETSGVSMVVFGIGSAIAGLAAVLQMFQQGAISTMGDHSIFVAFVVVVIGGIGSIPGSVLGGYLLGFVESLGLWKIPTEWEGSIAFAVLLFVMLVRPQGLTLGFKR